MEKNPLVSVLMSCYNSESTIREAIDSILNQTYRNFEFIIIDDASTDNSSTIIKSYNDSRIKLIVNEANKGLGANLQKGVLMANGDYIARMDSDDISKSQRLAIQVEYMIDNPDVICSGTCAEFFGAIRWYQHYPISWMRQETRYEAIKAHLLLGTPLLHPSVIINKKLLMESGFNYNPSFKRAQDYELWSNIAWKYRITNIPKVLVKYRYTKSPERVKYSEIKLNNIKIIYKNILTRFLGYCPTEEQLNTHLLFVNKANLSEAEFMELSDWLDVLHEASKKSDIITEKEFNSVFSEIWALKCNELQLSERIKVYGSKSYLGLYSLKNIFRLLR